MIKKTELNKKAVALRKKGFTYSEILKQVPVAKSTLSIWFGEVNLSKKQNQRITQKRLDAALRGASAKRQKRIELTSEIMEKAEKEVGSISKRELWLIGTTLYWAEGSKEKEWQPGNRVGFTNMDPSMIRVFIRWLYKCGVKKEDLTFDIFIHDTHQGRVSQIVTYWSKVTNFNKNKFTHIYFKKGNIKTKRKNVGENYYGVLKVIVKQSSTFLRRIRGWTNGIYKGIIASDK